MALRVLLVDDSATILLMQEMVLRPAGCEILVARNGRDAVDIALRERPDVIVMDVIMPEMDGFEACRRLRAEAFTQHTPIIVVTSRNDPASVEEGFASGCSDYLTKPLSGADLLAKVREHASSRSESA